MQQVVNVLFLGGAKRVSMARLLIAAGAKRNLDIKIFSYELSNEVPIAEVATVIVGRKWRDAELQSHLHDVVDKYGINIMLPFVDPAVEVAATYCANDSRCWTPGRNQHMAAVLFDKVASDTVFRRNGYPVPANALLEDFEGHIIAKPRFGSASKGIKVLDRENFEMMRITEQRSDYLFQQYIEHHEEFTVDCYVDASGKVVCISPRRRLEVAGGEVMSSVTVNDEAIVHWSRVILQQLQLTGPITLQFLCEKLPTGNMGAPLLMEINPRLGGGAVCSVHAGADLLGYILDEWQGIELPSNVVCQADVKICRYMQEVVFKNGALSNTN